jgi:hypothetical protein
MKTTLIFILTLLPALLLAQNEKPDPKAQLELAKEMLNQHYEYQKTIGKIQEEWALGKPLLKSRIEMIEGAISEMEAKTKEQAAKITETDEARGKVVAEDESLEGVLTLQLDRIEQLERRTTKLAPVLPEVLKTKLQPMIDRLPGPDKKREDIKSSISERYLNVIAVLNEIGKFQNELTVVNERRTLSDGRTAEVQALYFGLSQAFYAGIGATASEAGIGTVGPDGWIWTAQSELAGDIANMIQMIENGSSAAYVALPVTVK